MLNSSLMEGVLLLKQVVICSFLKKPSLESNMLDNYQPVSNLEFLGKMIKVVVESQMQMTLDELSGSLSIQFQAGHQSRDGLDHSGG